MPVNSYHPTLSQFVTYWQMLRDCESGEGAIKANAKRYLPMLPGQDENDYALYLSRPTFFNAVGRTVQGLHGTIFQTPPVVQPELPGLYSALEEDATLTGTPLSVFIKSAVEEVLITGRYGLLIDSPVGESDRPFFCGYAAESIINWYPHCPTPTNPLSLVVLKETVQDPLIADPFAYDERIEYKVLRLREGRVTGELYTQTTATADWVGQGELPMTRQGQQLTEIPFTFLGVTDLAAQPQLPPLIDQAYVNLAHYRDSADYAQARHRVGFPQPWVSTSAKMPEMLRIGPDVWKLAPQSSAGYMEYSGAGIGSQRQALIDYEAQMARLGAELLETPKEGVEAAETVKLRQSGRASVLANIAGTASRGFTRALRQALFWMGMAEQQAAQYSVLLNDDFVSTGLSAGDITGLMAAYLDGGMSLDTLIWNMKRGGRLPDDRSIEDEIALIQEEAAKKRALLPSPQPAPAPTPAPAPPRPPQPMPTPQMRNRGGYGR